MSFSKIVPSLISRKSNITLVRTLTKASGNLKSWKEIPGPSTLPFVGAMIHFIPIIGSIGPIDDFASSNDIIYKRYGPMVRFEGGFGSPPIILIYDVKLMEQVLRNEDLDPAMPERPGFPSLEYYRKIYSQHKFNEKSSGLLTEHADRWRSFRTAVKHVLLPVDNIKLYRDELDKVSIDVVERLKSLRNEKNMIDGDFELEMNKWGLESVGVVALGGRIGCLDGNIGEDSPARQLIQVVRDTFVMSDKLDNKPSIWRYFETKDFKKTMKVYEKQIELTRFFIKNAMNEYKNRDTTPENVGVLEKLLQVDEDIAVVMASDMLFAGVDTTAHSMLGILYLLGSNRDKQDLLRKEIQSTGPGDRRPYLRACIKEALRLLPVAGANLRRSTKEHVLNGYLIPERMNMGLMHEYTSKMECHFPRAKEYLPERWIVDRSHPLSYSRAHPFAYSPFGFGIRMCVGRRIAELEMDTFVARLIEAFDIEWFGPAPKRKASPLNYILGPYNFILRDAVKK